MTTPDTCPACQSAVDPGARFCKQCGATLEAPAAPADAPRRRPAPARDDARRSSDEGRILGMRPRDLAVGAFIGLGVGVGAMLLSQKDAPVTPPPAGMNDPHNHGAAPMMPGAQDLPPAGTIYVSGVVTLDPQAKASAPQGGVVYIMARSAANPQGPPLAAVRLPANPEGIPFAIGPQDMMMGGALTEPVRISARWDQDGDAMTRQPGDLVGEVTEPVQPGNMGVKITLAGVLKEGTDLNATASPTAGHGAPDSAPESAPESAPAAPTSAPAAPAGQEITGTLSFAPDRLPANPERGSIFLIARRADAAVGPPLAVVRMDGAPGPLPFTIGPANLMVGGAFDQPVLLTARWDEDGNAMTKGPNDVEGTCAANPVAPGARDVVIVMDKPSAPR